MIQFQNEAVTVFQSTLFQTTSTVVITEDLLLVVDPTWLPAEIAIIQEYVERMKGNRELFLLFTHGDFDHIIGYQAFPNAKVIASKEMGEKQDKQRPINQINQFDADFYVERDYTIEYPELDIVVKEEAETITIGNTTLHFHKAPGHTNDGLITLVEPLGVMIAGDYVSDFELPFIEDSAVQYISTLRKLKDIITQKDVALLVPGHGKVTNDKQEMFRRIDMGLEHIEALKLAIQQENDAELERLRKAHGFQSAFTDGCHEKNVEIIKKEFL